MFYFRNLFFNVLVMYIVTSIVRLDIWWSWYDSECSRPGRWELQIMSNLNDPFLHRRKGCL